MSTKWSRRRFLESGLAGSMIIGCGTATRSIALTGSPASPEAPPSSSFDLRQLEGLRAAMDEIIPAADGMPAASEVGGVDYLDRVARENPGIREAITHSLTALETITQAAFNATFSSLDRVQRVRALTELERRDAATLAALRDYVYEAYYTQRKVWKLIGYEFYPTNQAGPRMRPFNEAALAEVRKKPKHYREVR